MRNKQYAAIMLCVVAAFLVMGFSKFSIEKQVLINASLYDMSKQITDLHSWQQWYPLLKKTKSAVQYSQNTNGVNAKVSWDDHSLLTTAFNPAGIVVKETTGNNEAFQSISGFPANNGNSTIVSWTKKVNGFEWMKEKIFSSGTLSSGLENLKLLCESAATEYGFNIQVEPVRDTIIATKKIVAYKNEILVKQHALFDTLKIFLDRQQIPFSKKYIFVSTLSVEKKDSIAVAVGIPVNKKGIAANDIQFLELPANGRLLTGNYTGAYAGVTKLYMAMDRYIKDKGLKIAAQRMEEHSNFSSLKNDSGIVQIKLVYPVY